MLFIPLLVILSFLVSFATSQDGDQPYWLTDPDDQEALLAFYSGLDFASQGILGWDITDPIGLCNGYQGIKCDFEDSSFYYIKVSLYI